MELILTIILLILIKYKEELKEITETDNFKTLLAYETSVLFSKPDRGMATRALTAAVFFVSPKDRVSTNFGVDNTKYNITYLDKVDVVFSEVRVENAAASLTGEANTAMDDVWIPIFDDLHSRPP